MEAGISLIAGPMFIQDSHSGKCDFVRSWVVSLRFGQKGYKLQKARESLLKRVKESEGEKKEEISMPKITRKKSRKGYYTRRLKPKKRTYECRLR